MKKHNALISYLAITFSASLVFVLLARSGGKTVNLVAGLYMLVPAIAAVISRLFFYENKFRDAALHLGRPGNYFAAWGLAVGLAFTYYIAFTLSGAIAWDFSGAGFLKQVEKLQPGSGDMMIKSLPEGLSLQSMLILFTVGGLTLMNIPGIILGFGEEFGWRGFMFPLLHKINPKISLIIGGLIWFLWHTPLMLLSPAQDKIPVLLQLLRFLALAAGSVCTFIVLAYAFVKSGSIWVPSLFHIVLNNSNRALSYWVEVKNQAMADILLGAVMIAVVFAMYRLGYMKVFRDFKREN